VKNGKLERNKLENSDHVIATHTIDKCRGRACAIHNRSDHTMRAWPQHWRGDRQLMERICPCGVGHPDPDHMSWIRSVDPARAEWEGIHGCCECHMALKPYPVPTVAAPPPVAETRLESIYSLGFAYCEAGGQGRREYRAAVSGDDRLLSDIRTMIGALRDARMPGAPYTFGFTVAGKQFHVRVDEDGKVSGDRESVQAFRSWSARYNEDQRDR
jgi:hypothetical protein